MVMRKAHTMQLLPSGRGKNFYKGNMHTHSTNSDGTHTPQEVCVAYRDKGYDFLVVTDHFMERYNWPITDTSGYRSAGFTTLIGAELHAPQTELGELWHIIAIGLPLDFKPLCDDEAGPEIARRAYDTGAFIGIAHPSWSGLTHNDARSIPFAHAIEIFNYGSVVELDRGYDWPFLDTLLNGNWRINGYAADDAHKLTHDWLGGWVMVESPDLEPDNLLDSLKQGCYYSSHGPEIYDIHIEDESIVVACSEARVIAALGRGSKKSRSTIGEGLCNASLSVKPFKNSWFRVTVIDNQGRCAWSNPFWLS